MPRGNCGATIIGIKAVRVFLAVMVVCSLREQERLYKKVNLFLNGEGARPLAERADYYAEWQLTVLVNCTDR